MAVSVQRKKELIDQYQTTINTNPQVLLVVETAKPMPWHDKPKPLPLILLACFVGFVVAYLIAVYTEGRKQAP